MRTKTIIFIALIAFAAYAQFDDDDSTEFLRVNDWNDKDRRNEAFQHAREQIVNKTQDLFNRTRDAADRLRDRFNESELKERLQRKIQDDINVTLATFEKLKRKFQKSVNVSQEYLDNWKKAIQDNNGNRKLEESEDNLDDFIENELIRIDGLFKDFKDRARSELEKKAKDALEKQLKNGQLPYPGTPPFNPNAPVFTPKLEEDEEMDEIEMLKIQLPGNIKDKLKALKDKARDGITQKAKDSLKEQIDKKLGKTNLPVLEKSGFEQEIDEAVDTEFLRLDGFFNELKNQARYELERQAREALQKEM